MMSASDPQASKMCHNFWRFVRAVSQCSCRNLLLRQSRFSEFAEYLAVFTSARGVSWVFMVEINQDGCHSTSLEHHTTSWLWPGQTTSSRLCNAGVVMSFEYLLLRTINASQIIPYTVQFHDLRWASVLQVIGGFLSEAMKKLRRIRQVLLDKFELGCDAHAQYSDYMHPDPVPGTVWRAKPQES